MGKRKNHIDKVWRAIKAGAKTTREMEAMANIPVKACSSSVWQLVQMGLIRRAGKLRSHNGGPLTLYEVVKTTDASEVVAVLSRYTTAN